MAKSIKFTSSGSCSALGNFAPGDIARNIPDALADHLVREAMCAQYLAASAAAVVPVPSAPPALSERSSTPVAAVPRAPRKPRASAQSSVE